MITERITCKTINEELLVKQGMGHNREKIKELHKHIENIFKFIDSHRLECYNRDYVSHLEKLEYELQELWGFGKDRSKHEWWMKIPGCTCPKMDNEDLWGIDQRWYNSDCPWHGKESEYYNKNVILN